ncbi:membrane hypothetical protein [Candidatus Zixiibacteriota bacterium]|nr:membrane hypothetical protein [candidate division Zixibacteria bacterium]
MKKDKNISLILFIILLVLVAIKIIPFIWPDTRTWGFDHLIFVPHWIALTAFALMVISLLVALSELGARLGRNLVNTFCQTFFYAKWRIWYRLIFILSALVIFVIFSQSTHFLGDGYQNLGNLGQKGSTFLKWTEKGTWMVLGAVQSLLGIKDMQNALISYRLISYIAGAVSIWFYFLIAQIGSTTNLVRFITFSTLLLSGSLLLFFGYVENYSLLYPCLAGFIYFSLKYLSLGRNLSVAVLFLFMGILLHFQMMAFVPAFLFMVFYQGRGRKLFENYKKIILISAAAIASAGAILFMAKYRNDLAFRGIFMPLWTGFQSDPKYTLLSPSHLTDIMNQLLLLSPLIPFLAFSGFESREKLRIDKRIVFLALVSAGSLAFVLFVDPKLTMPRDWDLFSLSAFGMTLLFILSMREKSFGMIFNFIPVMVVIMLVSSGSYLFANLNTNRSIRYLNYIINLDKGKSLQSLGILGNYYAAKGDSKTADSIRTLLSEYYPDRSNIRLALADIERGNLGKAREIVNNLTPDPYSTEYMTIKVILYYNEGNYDSALAAVDSAIQNSRYMPQLYIYRSRILLKRHDLERAIETLQMGRRLSGYDNRELIKELLTIYDVYNTPDSIIGYARLLIRLDSTSCDGFYYLFIGYAKAGDSAVARQAIDNYYSHCKNDPLFDIRNRHIKKVFPFVPH